MIIMNNGTKPSKPLFSTKRGKTPRLSGDSQCPALVRFMRRMRQMRNSGVEKNEKNETAWPQERGVVPEDAGALLGGRPVKQVFQPRV